MTPERLTKSNLSDECCVKIPIRSLLWRETDPDTGFTLSAIIFKRVLFP